MIRSTFQEKVHIWAYLENSAQRGGLMIRPKIVPYLPVKQIIVILSHTDIYYQVMPLMPFLEISGNIVNRVTICFLQPGSWICHCYHSLSDIGHVQVHILPNRSTFRPRNYFTHKFYHLFISLLYHPSFHSQIFPLLWKPYSVQN